MFHALGEDDEAVGEDGAAEVAFDLHAASTAPQLRRALAKSDDLAVKRGCALALVRMGDPPSPLAEALAKSEDVAWRRRAALAFAESGDARGASDLAAWWADKEGAGIDFERQKELLSAIGKVHARGAVPSLAASLEDVRLRPYVADTLGAIGDPAARAPLLAALGREPYVTTRPHEARALVALGATGWASASPVPTVEATLATPKKGEPARLVVLSAAAGASCAASVDGAPLVTRDGATDVHVFAIAPDAMTSAKAVVHVDDPAGIQAIWLIAHPIESDADAGASEP